MKETGLAEAAKTVAQYICNVRQGEDVLLYADVGADRDIVDAIANACREAGGETCVLCFGRRPVPDLEPPAPLAAAMKSTDVLIELADMYLIHTETLLQAQLSGARFACLTMMTRGIMERCIGPIEWYAKVVELGECVTSLLEAASSMHITTPAGTDLVCNIEGRTIDHASRPISGPGEQTYPAGQVSWYPHAESIQGIMVFDGAIWPPEGIGLLETPIVMTVRDGRVTGIDGGREAGKVAEWFEAFENPHAYDLAHISYGVNPGATLCGNILEDERILGGIEVGIGAQPPQLGIFQVDPEEATRSHTDAVMLCPTVGIDGQVIERDGEFVHPDLVSVLESF